MSETAAYAASEPGKIKRVWLAVFLCGVASCVIVTVIGAAILFVFSFLSNLTNLSGPGLMVADSALGAVMNGMAAAALAATFNGFVFYITIPAATIALAASIGRFPKRRISAPAPYLRWGAIWGSILVSVGAVLAALAVLGSGSEFQILVFVGAILLGSGIGAAAGVTCAGLFLLIVKPARQIQTVDASVF